MMITPKQALNRWLDKHDLSFDEMYALMRQIMQGEVAAELLSGLLVALRFKGETLPEITAAVQVMREFATPVPIQAALQHDLVDIVGTGGDGAKTFNISTTAMFVMAAAGAKVAKHGGKSVSSSSGAADVLSAMGADLAATPQNIADDVDKLGLGFMFAPNHHTAMRHVAPVRQALGIRTIFNILGPMTNPAGAKKQLIGVFDSKWCPVLAQVLQQLGSERVLVVNGSDGLDEITLTGSTHISELKHNIIHNYEITPEELGLSVYANLDAIRVENAQESWALMQAVLDNTAPDVARDIVIANAAAGLYVADVVENLAQGVDLARETLRNGLAKQKQQDFVRLKHRSVA